MQKIVLSLTLLYSLQLTPSAAQPAPEQPVADESVREAVGQLEISQVLPEIEKLEAELCWPISSRDRAEIIAALGYLVARRELNQVNFQEKAKLVIAQVIAQRALDATRPHLREASDSAIRVASSMGRNAKVAIESGHPRRSVLNEYSGWQLDNKVKTAAHNAVYAHDRHCNPWCW